MEDQEKVIADDTSPQISDSLDDDTYEICELCGETTRYLKTDKMSYRRFFIQGIPQLCQRCTVRRREIDQEPNESSDWERYG